MTYENKTNEELIELLEEKDEEIQQLECKADDLEMEQADYVNEIESMTECSIDKQEQEELAEKSFYAGLYSSRNLTLTPLKAWLNYKMENIL